MKQIIKLTENDLKRIISESVKRILKEDTNSFILRDVIIDGMDVTTTFKNYYGNSFDSKYELKDALNLFLNNYGIKLIDLDLANEFGESSDEVYIQSEPVNIVEVLKEINFKEIYKKDRRAYAQVEVYFVETFDYDFGNIPAGYTSIESDTCLVYSPKDDMWMD